MRSLHDGQKTSETFASDYKIPKELFNFAYIVFNLSNTWFIGGSSLKFTVSTLACHLQSEQLLCI